ncbi:hypothetical protein ACHAWC_005578 [Mediolabrus comicus]
MEKWRNKRDPVSIPKWNGGTVELIRFPDSIVPKTPRGHYYSRRKKYKCAADVIEDGACVCKAYGEEAWGYKCYELESGEDVWLCAPCEQSMGLRPTELDPLTLVTESREDPLLLCFENSTVKIPLCGGAQELAIELVRDGHLIVTRWPTPTDKEILEHCGDIWYLKHPGLNRGCEFTGSDGNFRRVRNALMSMENSRKVIEYYEQEGGGRKIYFIIPALYGKSILANVHNSFKSHCDKRYKGKPPYRSIWTWNEGGKVMRFQSRVTGVYIDIACQHGTIVEQDWYASGCNEGEGEHEMEHAVFFGDETASIVFDHGSNDGSDELDVMAAFEEFERELDGSGDEEDGGGD